VTSLEPRTPHQLEKLKKLSKNDSVFTPSIVYVNRNYSFVSTCLFNRVHAVHKPVTGNGATAPGTLLKSLVRRGFPPKLLGKCGITIEFARRLPPVKILQNLRCIKDFALCVTSFVGYPSAAAHRIYT
jgi:hypothetical protein